ncbi:hypothetical protein [Flavihumibacter fluvii]|uniref:hypothetical protein n=1 Tax=Flavihumibacter fluvii TaxID=2838157 RepID=UPI001BDF6A04|nr:hypothetical protein [Flavihumibacter fluvii]ULQ53261.1 hypothetical protein KJS93_02890 [Flavihumibacter fluvii]
MKSCIFTFHTQMVFAALLSSCGKAKVEIVPSSKIANTTFNFHVDRNALLPQDIINSLPEVVDILALHLDASQRKDFQQRNILNQEVYLKNYLSSRIAWPDTIINSSRFD